MIVFWFSKKGVSVNMFEIGDFVIKASNGICRVDNIEIGRASCRERV